MKKYLVGGAVRDSILQIPVKERDWVVVDSTPQEMIAQGYQQVGNSFPVFLNPKTREEYALARTERKFGQGYTGFICYTSPKVTLEEDLKRRDLTINAIACDMNGNLIDPYYGIKDIHLRCLRHISSSFQDDPLRVLRVARFAARFAHMNFYIAQETLELMQCMTNELPLLAAERVWKETELALNTRNPQVYFQVLRNCGALKILFNEIDTLFEILELPKKNLEINVGFHTLLALEIAAKLSEDIAVRFSVLCFNLGKIINPYQLKLNNNYNDRDIKAIDILCQRLKIPNYLKKIAKIVIQNHDILYNIKNAPTDILIKLFNSIDVWRQPKRLEQIITVITAYSYAYKKFKNKFYQQEVFLRKAFQVLKGVNIGDIIKDGFNGIHISQELNYRRQQAINNWKKSINNYQE